MKSRLFLRASLQSKFFLVRFITSTTVTWKTYPRTPKPKIISFSGEIEEEEEAKPRVELHKSRGQHILTNLSVVKSIVRKAGVKKTDIVLEIGSGTGNLTLELLQAARKVIAVEIDPRMIETLNKRIHGTEMAQRLQGITLGLMYGDLDAVTDLVVHQETQAQGAMFEDLHIVTDPVHHETQDAPLSHRLSSSSHRRTRILHAHGGDVRDSSQAHGSRHASG
ncbi:uncharacterized protein LOC131070238 isoform X1 [Cryptomeria japonica]|uniref:uncharacterized protein LOC131070238 isoform X1 n=1 Tax=Cryptomeria japonica TaxID=3369 RepID=UPI0027DA747F|nr:uncharacterized protein LOC131070238 isoform X1 [Cryptomeria japonica]